MTATFYVYLISRLDGRPCYVGKGKGDRWTRHEGRARHYNRHLGSIIDQARALGEELPKVKIAEGLAEDEAFRIERELIALIGREANGGPLVNLTDGGDGPAGYQPSPELIERQAATRRGRKLSPEWKMKISRALKGKSKSTEHIAAAATARRGVKNSAGWWSTEEGRAKQRQNNRGHTGHRHSPETREKIRQTLLAKKNVSTAGYFKKPGEIHAN